MSKLLSFFKNRTWIIVISLSLAFLISACGNRVTTQPTESILSQIEAAVTATLNAQASAAAQDSSSLPTATLDPTATPTPTSDGTPTQIVLSPTSTISYSSYSTYYSCEESEFIKDMTIPDGTVFSPGETFTKTWKFRNTGSCNWTSDYSIVFIDGDDMDGSDTEIDQTVYVDKKAELSVELTAPDDEGTYTGYWQLEDDDGNTFGDTVYVEIVVKEDTATSTPTPTYTATPTSTSLSTVTSTPIVTNTLEPTLTPTLLSDTPAPTPTAVPMNTATPGATETPTDIPTTTPTVINTEAHS